MIGERYSTPFAAADGEGAAAEKLGKKEALRSEEEEDRIENIEKKRLTQSGQRR